MVCSNYLTMFVVIFDLIRMVSIFSLSVGRGSQSQTKPNNENTQQKRPFPSLQSSFTKQEQQSTSEDISSTNQNSSIDQISEKKPQIANKSDSDSEDDVSMARPSFSLNSSSTVNQKQPENHCQTKSLAKPLQQQRISDTGFIIYETLSQNDQQQSSINILQVSAAKQGATIKCDVEVSKTNPNTLNCVVRINDTVYGTALITTGKKEARVQAFDNALQYARKIHYTIKVNCEFLFSSHIEF